MVSTIKKKRAAVECNKNTSELLNNKKRQDAQQNKKRKSTSASSSPACRRRLLSSSEGRETGTVVQILSFGFGLVKCQRISITLFGFQASSRHTNTKQAKYTQTSRMQNRIVISFPPHMIEFRFLIAILMSLRPQLQKQTEKNHRIMQH